MKTLSTTLALFGIWLPTAWAYGHDGEWPPLADPYWDPSAGVLNNPSSTFNSHLQFEGISLAVPNSPLPYADWVTHFHGPSCSQNCHYPFGGRKALMTIGDVDNDGQDDDVVIVQPGEAAFAAKINVDWTTGTGSLDPLGLWLSPWATTVMGGTPSHPADAACAGTTADPNPRKYLCEGTQTSNALIWDLDGDGLNEVVVFGVDEQERNRLFVLQYDDVLQDLKVIASSDPMMPDSTDPSYGLGGGYEARQRLGICRVSNTPYARDIVCAGNDDGLSSDKFYIWSFVNGELRCRYDGNVVLNPEIDAHAHEFNWADVDGDGFDEFAVNGLLDFTDADANGDPVDVNGRYGIARWQALGAGEHCDRSLIADWDPTRPGLEMYILLDRALVGATGNFDRMYDADCGDLLDEWSDGPSEDGQTLFGGNWSSASEGLEAILSPKDDAGGPSEVIPPGQAWLTSCYATRFRTTQPESGFELLAVDGAYYKPSATSGPGPYGVGQTLRRRSGGPWRNMAAIDWDGDYASDEILHHAIETGPVSLFKLHSKADLDPLNPPMGIPTQAQIMSTMGPIQEPGSNPICTPFSPNFWWWYAQGECGTKKSTWGWNFNGPGRGTHVFQKLKEEWPGNGPIGAIAAAAYDLPGSGDHREEIIALSVNSGGTAQLHVYRNTAPLAPSALTRPSPRGSLLYKAYRQSLMRFPFSFQDDAVTFERFVVEPANAALPNKVVGTSLGGAVPLRAFIEFSDGSRQDVSSSVQWTQDPESVTQMSISATGVVTEFGGVTVSGRFQAMMEFEGKMRSSDPIYVFASSSNRPAVLRAGFEQTWLTTTPAHDDRRLTIKALVGQRRNLAVKIYPQRTDGSLYLGMELKDDGTGGDQLAGDGLYTAVVDDPAGLAAGDNLMVLRALLPPIYYVGGLPGPQSQNPSKPWPFFAKGPAGLAPWSPILEAPQIVVPESESYEAPRIASMGFRGWQVPGELLIEVEVAESPFHAEVVDESPAPPAYNTAQGVALKVPGVANLITLQPAGGRLYTAKLPTNNAGNGLYMLQTAPWILDLGGVFFGQPAPLLFQHAFPSWDADEPALLNTLCLPFGPSGW